VFLLDGAVVESGPSQTIFRNPADSRTRQFVATLTGEAA
jgi:ABC-type phosphate transport system ATPase subunit